MHEYNSLKGQETRYKEHEIRDDDEKTEKAFDVRDKIKEA